MKDHRWAAIDVETATNHRRSICSLGVATIAPDGSRVEREWLVKPPGNRYDAAQNRTSSAGRLYVSDAIPSVFRCF